MIGMESVAGRFGHHGIRATFERWNERIFRPLLLKKEVAIFGGISQGKGGELEWFF
jgi:hypothetical protein